MIRSTPTLGMFIDEYIAFREDVSERCRTNWRSSRASMVKFFGVARDLRSIGVGDADGWRQFIVNTDAEATVAGKVKHAKQFFKHALRKGLVDANPFAELKGGSQHNANRLEFVSREAIQRVIEAAPDAEWRLLIALARYAGLRTPSEPFLLTWDDINWERRRFVVTAPKTKSKRIVPMFPELYPYFADCLELADPGSKYVITRYRNPDQNLRTQLKRIICKAGLVPWEKPWQNLRSSCETELTDRFPVHVAAAWVGNSVKTAARHYLQVTDEHFETAVQEVALNPALLSSAKGRNGSQTTRDGMQQTPKKQAAAEDCSCLRSVKARPVGFEDTPTVLSLRRNHIAFVLQVVALKREQSKIILALHWRSSGFALPILFRICSVFLN